MLTKVISGFIVAAAIILSIIFLKPVWLLMVMFLSMSGTHELYKMLLNKQYRVHFWVPAAMNGAILIAMYYLLSTGDFSQAKTWLEAHAGILSLQNMLVLFSCLALIITRIFFTPRATIPELTVPIFQITYLGWFPCFFILIRFLPQGEFFLVWGLTSVAFSDMGAYFAGKYLGKRPYFQHLSPNKTLEGAVGGICSSIGIAFILAFAFGSNWLPISPLHCFLMTLGMACLGQVGDLIESLIKRDADVKDSGTFIPGHGGILDRVDSYLLLAPFMYYYLVNFVLISPGV